MRETMDIDKGGGTRDAARRRSLCQRLKENLAFSGEGVTKPNWLIIGLMFISLFASAFTLTFLFPFLPEMILGFGFTEEQKGYYTGLVASSVFAGRATGSYLWGWLSDRRGRKPVLLLSLIGGGTFSLLFGFTQNLAMAISARFLSGVFNGILGTAKTVLYEVSDDTNQAVGMSMISLAWGAGIIMGPAVGGHLASPFQKYPDVFHEGFFTQFPYILPAAVTFVVNIIAAVIIWWKLPETLQLRNRVLEIPENEVMWPGEDQPVSDMATIKPMDSSDSEVKGSHKYDSIDSSSGTKQTQENKYIMLPTNEKNCVRRESLPQGKTAYHQCRDNLKSWTSCPNISGHDVEANGSGSDMKVRGHICSNGCLKRESIVEYRSTSDKQSENGHLLRERSSDVHINDGMTKPFGIWAALMNSSFVTNTREKDVRNSIILFTIFSFAIIGFDDVFTVWASTEPRLDGLGFSPDKIGTVLSLVGIPLLLLLIFMLSFMVKHFGIKKTYMISAFIIMLSVTVCPTLHLLSDRPSVLWPVMLVVLIPLRLCASCCFSTTALFINNSVTPDRAGAVNGIGMTFTAIARTLAPSIGGSTFAWSVSNGLGPPFDVSMVFFFFGMVFWITIIVCIFFPDRLNKQRK